MKTQTKKRTVKKKPKKPDIDKFVETSMGRYRQKVHQQNAATIEEQLDRIQRDAINLAAGLYRQAHNLREAMHAISRLARDPQKSWTLQGDAWNVAYKTLTDWGIDIPFTDANFPWSL